MGKDWVRQDAERLVRKLVCDSVLKEDLKITAMDHAACYIKLGARAADLMRGAIKVELPIQGKGKRQDCVKVGVQVDNRREGLVAQCVGELRQLARAIAAEHQVKNYALIFPESALKQLAERCPTTIQELVEQIDHFNYTKADKYRADRFLEITQKYSLEMATLAEDDQPAVDGVATQEEGWASHYFAETASSASGGGEEGLQGGTQGGQAGRFWRQVQEGSWQKQQEVCQRQVVRL